jgi:L-seryl-tRNA(Ser) seleniumtransferase
VPLDQLKGAASRAIAVVTGAEAGLVTAGAAAALTLGAAAILTGHDLGRMERLPHCKCSTWMTTWSCGSRQRS